MSAVSELMRKGEYTLDEYMRAKERDERFEQRTLIEQLQRENAALKAQMHKEPRHD